MAKFRKLPVVVEASQWHRDGDHPRVEIVNAGLVGVPAVVTDHGPIVVHPGDWIITGVKGEVYPCSPDVFALTYEPIPEPRPMTLRFGPRLSHTVPTPAPAPEPAPDVPAKVPVQVDGFIDSAEPSINGLFTLNVGAVVPAYSLDSSKRLIAVAVVVVPDGQPLPETEQGFLDSAYPKAEIDVSAESAGVHRVFPVHGVTAGSMTVQYILRDED